MKSKFFKGISITQQIYIMLFIVVFYGASSLALKHFQAMKTLDNFQNMQRTQFKLVIIADNIKAKLSKIQNLQVQFVVDTIMEMEDAPEKPVILDMSSELLELKEYAEFIGSEELNSLYKKINIRYSILVKNNDNLDVEEIKADPEEALSAIEGMTAISGKINEELSILINISRTQLKTAIVEFENKIHTRLKRVFVFGVVSLIIFIIAGLLFARTIKRKINLLVGGTTAFSENKFNYRIPIANFSCKDELCELATSFNQMAISLEDLIEKQKETNQFLDKKVQEQTFKIRKNLEEIEKSNTVVMDSINYASRIQHSLLPNRNKMKDTMGDHFIIWNQRDVVGGDFYWMEEVEDGYIVALIDCTGHGVPGSLMTMISVPALDRIIREHNITNPSTILGMLNRSLQEMLSKGNNELGDDGLDAGICYVNTKNKTVTFSSAGIPLFFTKNGEINEIKGDRKGVGYKDTDLDYNFKEHIIEVDSEMSFYMATDGITEQVGGTKKRMMFGRKRLRELLKDIHVKAKYEQKNMILETLSEYRGDEPQKDDMTCISFKIEN